jgi:spermidine/putrescine transport system ATP-binding protein
MSDQVQLIGISKMYGTFQAIADIDLTVGAGRFVTLLGPSGCGKSTLLRMIAGFEDVTDGKVIIAGQDVSYIPPNLRNVNMVFQDYALFPHLTVAQNIEFGLKRRRIAQHDRAIRVKQMLALVQLVDKADRFPDQLSGGQRQRVALARALAVDPAVLLLDEPMGALDAQLRGQMQVELRELQRKTGKTFILVTHDQAEALSMSDDIVVMNQGRIEQIGTPDEVYRSPKTKFVADFLGEANYFTGTIQADQQGNSHIALGGDFRMGLPRNFQRSSNDEVVKVMVRPERLRIHSKNDASPGVMGVVESIMYFGASTRVKVKLLDGSDILVSVQASERGFSVGEEVRISWSGSDAVYINE